MNPEKRKYQSVIPKEKMEREADFCDGGISLRIELLPSDIKVPDARERRIIGNSQRGEGYSTKNPNPILEKRNTYQRYWSILSSLYPLVRKRLRIFAQNAEKPEAKA
jgi:hypothetical protein